MDAGGDDEAPVAGTAAGAGAGGCWPANWLGVEPESISEGPWETNTPSLAKLLRAMALVMCMDMAVAAAEPPLGAAGTVGAGGGPAVGRPAEMPPTLSPMPIPMPMPSTLAPRLCSADRSLSGIDGPTAKISVVTPPSNVDVPLGPEAPMEASRRVVRSLLLSCARDVISLLSASSKTSSRRALAPEAPAPVPPLREAAASEEDGPWPCPERTRDGTPLKPLESTDRRSRSAASRSRGGTRVVVPRTAGRGASGGAVTPPPAAAGALLVSS